MTLARRGPIILASDMVWQGSLTICRGPYADQIVRRTELAHRRFHMISLFHVHEKPLAPGTLIGPGRWGTTILNMGKSHPFFFREHLLEIWRREKTQVQVSRWSCTFAFGERQDASKFAAKSGYVHSVVPVDESVPKARLDQVWLTWIGEPRATTEKIMGWCAGYWAGRATTDLKPEAIASWEWLFACPLRVVDAV